MIINGVYNADYIESSLELYDKQKDVIGSVFEITWLCWRDNKLVPNSWLKFSINEYKKILDVINLWKSNPDFVAYSIKTDKNFVTHYYCASGLEKMFCQVYPKDNISINSSGDRYLIVKIIMGDAKRIDTMLTTLNNVIGNILSEHQIESLTLMKKLFM